MKVVNLSLPWEVFWVEFAWEWLNACQPVYYQSRMQKPETYVYLLGYSRRKLHIFYTGKPEAITTFQGLEKFQIYLAFLAKTTNFV